jgi:hypothetical protein
VSTCIVFYKNFMGVPCCRQIRLTCYAWRRGIAQRGDTAEVFDERSSRDAGRSRCTPPLRASTLPAMQ